MFWNNIKLILVIFAENISLITKKPTNNKLILWKIIIKFLSFNIIYKTII